MEQPAYNDSPVIRNMVDEFDPRMLQQLWARSRDEMGQWELRLGTQRKNTRRRMHAEINAAKASGASCGRGPLDDQETSMDVMGTRDATHGVKQTHPDDKPDEERSIDGMGTSGASCGKKRKGSFNDEQTSMDRMGTSGTTRGVKRTRYKEISIDERPGPSGASPDKNQNDPDNLPGIDPILRLHGHQRATAEPAPQGKKHLFAVSQPGKKHLFAVSLPSFWLDHSCAQLYHSCFCSYSYQI
jgi:hypothetical protein